MFLNLWHCTLRDKLVDFLLEHHKDTDIFCFQEVYESRRLLNFIHDDFNKVFVDKILLGDEYYSNEIFFNKTIEIIETDEVTMNIDNVGVGIYAVLKSEEKLFYLCNYHGVPRPKPNKKDTPARLTQSNEIIKYFESKKGPKIIGGDFNLDINTKSVKLFEEAGYINLIKKFNIERTRNKIAWKKFPQQKQMYADYVFVSPEVKVRNFEVIENEISDHLPMILEIDL